MYTSFFGFSCKPFQLTPDPEFLFLSSVHKRALTYLQYGIAENSGFLLLTGDIGAGKTTIIRTMLRQLPHEIRLARVNNTKVSSDELIAMINDDFGIDTKDRNKSQMLADLTDFLIRQYAEGGRAVIVIDEAQNLSADLLEEMRLLSNLETDKAKLLQIILIGQPELNAILSRHELEQLRQRIAINTYIGALARAETEEYIMHRLRVAGNEHAVTFAEGVMDEIHDFSKGIPRLINILCDFALLAAFVDERRTLDLEFIKGIAGDLINERPEARDAARSHGPQKPGTYEKVRKALMKHSLRLQRLEKAMLELQSGTVFTNHKWRLLKLKEAELDKRDADLLKRECALIEREQALARNEGYLAHAREHTVKEFPADEESA